MRSSELEKSASKGGKYTIILQSQGLVIHNAPKSSILSDSGPIPKSDQNQGICKIKCKTLSVFNMDKKRASLQTVAGITMLGSHNVNCGRYSQQLAHLHNSHTKMAF